MATILMTKRPALLTLTCILSIAFSIWGLYKGIHWLMVEPQKFVQQAEMEAEEQRSKLKENMTAMTMRIIDSGLEMKQNEATNATALGIGGILVSAISLLGVGLMWNMRKVGFGPYLLASVGSLALLLAFSGNGMMAKIVVAGTGLFALVFIILYAVNLKYMH